MKGTVITAALLASFVAISPAAVTAGSVGVNFQIDAYLPAPPGVRIFVEAGRPYYIEDNRRIYMEKKPKYDKGKHRGHYKKHEGKGRKHGKKGKHDD